MGFADDIRKWADRTKRDRDTVIAEVVTDLSTAIIDRTPIGDVSIWQSPPPPGYRPGTMVNSWHSSVGQIGPMSARGPNTTGAASLTNLAAIAPLAPGKLFSFTNPVPYARRIEFGWSTQAPTGMVRLTTARFRQIVKAAIRGN
jgi:hypothetical protein